MKRFAIAALGAFALSACATASTLPDPDFDPSANSFTGWVRVSGGEFQLFKEQRDLRERAAPLRCVSGALPRNAQEAAGDLNGTQVAFTGRAVAWSKRDGVQTMTHEGARIQNLCRNDYVIKAQSVRVLR